MIIVDVDGCISDDSRRIMTIDWQTDDPIERYDLYHMLSITDPPGNLHVLEGVQPSEIIILTAMPKRYRKLREVWLATHRIRHGIMVMRDNDDHSPSDVLKLKMIDWLIDEYRLDVSQITAAYDDRQRVVDAYLGRGIPGKLLKLHDVCAYSPKTGG